MPAGRGQRPPAGLQRILGSSGADSFQAAEVRRFQTTTTGTLTSRPGSRRPSVCMQRALSTLCIICAAWRSRMQVVRAGVQSGQTKQVGQAAQRFSLPLPPSALAAAAATGSAACHCRPTHWVPLQQEVQPTPPVHLVAEREGGQGAQPPHHALRQRPAVAGGRDTVFTKRLDLVPIDERQPSGTTCSRSCMHTVGCNCKPAALHLPTRTSTAPNPNFLTTRLTHTSTGRGSN